MTEPFRIAAFGTTHPHISVRLDVARRIDGIELAGVSDPDPANAEMAKKLADHLGTQILTPEEVLERDDIHGVIVEPWTYEMVDYTIRCIEAGKAVLVEKPGGSNPEDLRRMVEAGEKSGGTIQIGYNFRFSPMINMAQDILKSGILGNVVQAQVHGAGPAGDATHRWFNLPGDLGGCFWEDGCHLVDIILALFGVPGAVTARMGKYDSVSTAETREDAAIAIFEYPQMMLGFDFTSWEANEWLETWQFSFYGDKGTFRFQMLPESFELYLKEESGIYKKGWTRWEETTFPTPWADEPTPWEEWHVVANKSFFFREISAFRDAALAKKESVIPPKQALDIARVMEACFQSSTDETRVELAR